ncbi:transcriptional regulator [Longimycelium tulufanense]|uniref:Transcriptional regulator n=1 Tax=Longimycelium tulufanense TaxID=907463 RepID=A0A8J3C8V2_9PSEU|nr:helix-turn-helix transcriptional regulator [Longimycelium tulufanense]GGM57774.1 transcriptional regulator [Longimycelium tulufanense]
MGAATMGERVALERKLAGLTQQQLAARTHYSTSMVRAVEQGRTEASTAFLAAVARALRIELEQLTGQPYREEMGAGTLPDIADIRALLAEGSRVRAVDPGDPAELAADLAEVRRLRREDKGRQALSKLPVLLRRLHGAAHAGGEVERGRAYDMLALAYTSTAMLTYRFGFLPLAALAIDRAETAAERAADPRMIPHALVHRGLLLMSYASYDSARDMIREAMRTLEDVPRDEGALAVLGSAHLRGAIINARSFNLDSAREHIAEAARIGRHVGRETTAYDTNFGPGNVELHRIGVELDGGDPGRAAQEGGTLRLPADMKPTRLGHHHMDMARAWMLAGKPDKALRSLNTMRRIAPQQCRLHPNVRETVRLIAVTERRKTDSLTAFVGWLGMKL